MYRDSSRPGNRRTLPRIIEVARQRVTSLERRQAESERLVCKQKLKYVRSFEESPLAGDSWPTDGGVSRAAVGQRPLPLKIITPKRTTKNERDGQKIHETINAIVLHAQTVNSMLFVAYSCRQQPSFSEVTGMGSEGLYKYIPFVWNETENWESIRD